MALAAALGAVAFLAVGAWQSLVPGVVLDDAYIAFRYARNLAAGEGLVFVPGVRAEGYTSFLWVLVAALGEAAGVGSAAVMPLVGLAAGACLVLLVAGAAALAGDPEASEADGHAPDASGRVALDPGTLVPVAFSAVLLVAHPALTFYAGTGLETVGYALALTAAVLALGARSPAPFVVLTTLAFMLRPEAGLLGLVGTAWRAAASPRPARALATLVGAFALAVGPYLLWKGLYFGDLLPLTARAKAPVLRDGVRYALEAWWPTAGLTVLAALRVHRLGWRTLPGGALLYWVAAALGTALVGPDWMPAGRLLAPAFPALVVALFAGGARLPGPRGQLLWLAALLLFLVPSGRETVRLHGAYAGRLAMDERIAEFARVWGDRGVGSVATVNIGLVGYVLPAARIVDLAGLTDPEIARLPGGHLKKRPPSALLAAREPDAFLLTSSEPIVGAGGRATYRPDMAVEAHVFALPWFHERYAYAASLPLARDYHYHWFVRRDWRPRP